MITWLEYNERVRVTVSRERTPDRDRPVERAFMDVLRDTRPDLVGVVRDTGADPLYSGNTLSRFLTVIREHW